jgi:DNA-binding MarR family transcriptional regulator
MARPRTVPAPDAAVRWLDEDEMSAWLPLLRLVQLLPQALDKQLRSRAGVNHVYYMLLAILSGRPDRRLPLTELADAAAMSQSRTSHAVAALVERGWVTRKPCPTDRRVQYVELTVAGTRVLKQNAPGHVAEVRRLVFDQLEPGEVDQLRALARKVVSALDA